MTLPDLESVCGSLTVGRQGARPCRLVSPGCSFEYMVALVAGRVALDRGSGIVKT